MLCNLNCHFSVLKLKNKTRFGEHVQPACMAHVGWQLPEGFMCVVTGWGQTSSSSTRLLNSSIGSMRTVRDFKIFLESFQFYFIVFPQFSARPPWTTCLILTVLIFIKMQTWIQLMICNASVPDNHLALIRIGSPDTYRWNQRHRSGQFGEPW